MCRGAVTGSVGLGHPRIRLQRPVRRLPLRLHPWQFDMASARYGRLRWHRPILNIASWVGGRLEPKARWRAWVEYPSAICEGRGASAFRLTASCC
jgi:hypothetical protein